MLRRTVPVGVFRMIERDRLKSLCRRCSKRWYWTPERASWKLEEVGQAREGDEAGVVGEGGDPGEESAVDAEGDRDAGLPCQAVDGQMGVGRVGLSVRLRSRVRAGEGSHRRREPWRRGVENSAPQG